MNWKIKFSKLALTTTMLLQTGCVKDLPVPAQYIYPPTTEILELHAGQIYTAPGAQKWYSAAKYQRLELDYLNAIAALKQAQNR